MTLPNVIAAAAVLAWLAAALGNGWLLWRYRPYGIMSAIPVAAIGLAAWVVGGYILLLIGAFPDLDPPVNVIVQRPAMAMAGILLAVNAAAMATAIQRYNHNEDLRERISRAHAMRNQLEDCQRELATERQTNLVYRDLDTRRREEAADLRAKIQRLERIVADMGSQQ